MKTVVPVASALLLFLIVLLLPGCSAIAGIFKAGVWAGIALVGIVLLLVIFLFSRGKK
jgi:hypothetical protein